MKKLLALAGSVALLLSASILTSCGDMTGDETNYSAATDTVITLSAPDVHGNAYYGVNYVWWNPVTSAKTYLVYRNGQYVGSKTSGQTLEFVDAVNTPAGGLTAIEDNKSYKYEVVATNGTTITSTTDTVARQVYLRDNKGSVSLTAKVPTTEEFNKAVQNSLSYTKDATSTASFGLSSKVTFSEGANGYFIVDFPAKAWLNYHVYTVTKGLVDTYAGLDFDELLASEVVGTAFTPVYTSENSDAHVTLPITSAGDKEVYVVASAKGLNGYEKLVASSLDSTTKAAKVVTIATLGEKSATTSLSASYISSSVVRVKWTPAKLYSGTSAATTSYKVYRKQNNAFTLLTGEVASLAGTTLTYYIDDTAVDTKYDATYIVVVTDGTSYGTAATKTVNAVTTESINAATIGDIAVIDYNADGSQDLTFTVTADSNETLAVGYVYNATSKAAALNTAYTGSTTALTEVSANEADEVVSATSATGKAKVYYYTIPNAQQGTYAIKATTSYNGATNSVYTTKDVKLTLSATTAPAVTAEAKDLANDSSANDILATIVAGEAQTIANVVYGYSEVSADEAKANAQYAGTAIVTSTIVTGDTAESKTTYYVSKTNADKGYYYFIATVNEAGKLSASGSAALQVTAEAPATTAPTFDVAFVDLNNDDKEDDALFVVTGAEDQTYTVVYGYSDVSAEVAAQNLIATPQTAFTDASPAEDEVSGKWYAIRKKNGLDAGYYSFKLTASETGYADNTVTVAAELKEVTLEKTATPDVEVVTDELKATITITSTKDQKFTVKYGYAKTKALAEWAVISSSVGSSSTVATDASGTLDVNTGKYIYEVSHTLSNEGFYVFQVTASETGYANAIVRKDAVELKEADKEATADPELTVTPVDATDRTKGVYFTLKGTTNQRLSLNVGYSADSMNLARSASRSPIGLPDTNKENLTTQEYGFTRTYTYGTYGRDLTAAGYYYYVLTASEDDKDDASVAVELTVEKDAESTKTALDAPVFSPLEFVNSGEDGRTNDLAEFTVTVEKNAKLASVFYATGETAAQAKANVLSESSNSIGFDATSYATTTAGRKVYTFAENANFALETLDTTYYAFVAVVDDADSTDDTEYASAYTVYANAIQPSYVANSDANLTIATEVFASDASTTKNDIVINIRDKVATGDAASNYNYYLYRATVEDAGQSAWVAVASTTGYTEDGNYIGVWLAKQLEADTNDDLEYLITYTDYNKDDGTYVYKVVKTSSIGGESVEKLAGSKVVAVDSGSSTNYDTLSALAITATTTTNDTTHLKETVTLSFKFSNTLTVDENYRYDIKCATYRKDASSLVVANYTTVVTLYISAYFDTSDASKVTYTMLVSGNATDSYFYFVEATNRYTGEVVYSNLVPVE